MVVYLECEHCDSSERVGGTTHNLAKMACEAGLYKPMWRPDENGMIYGRDLVEPLRAGIAKLEADPEHFRQWNPTNRWGCFENLLKLAQALLEACEQSPNKRVRVCR